MDEEKQTQNLRAIYKPLLEAILIHTSLDFGLGPLE